MLWYRPCSAVSIDVEIILARQPDDSSLAAPYAREHANRPIIVIGIFGAVSFLVRFKEALLKSLQSAA